MGIDWAESTQFNESGVWLGNLASVSLIQPRTSHINLRWCYVNKFKVYKTKTIKIWFYSTEKWRKFKILILSNWGMVLFYLVIYLVSWICFIVVGLEIPYSFMILALSNPGCLESSIILIFFFRTQSSSLRSFWGFRWSHVLFKL